MANSFFDSMIIICDGKVNRGSDYVNNNNDYKTSTYEKTKAQVYATGNKWAIENFHATHD